MKFFKRISIFFLALIAFLGVINCIVIEPALAQLDSHHTQFSGEEDGHCDFICHSSHHLWDADSILTALNQPLASEASFVSTFLQETDPPLAGIFHPPLILA